MKNKKGFTLIEIIAVVTILGILLLIAIPTVTGYILKSRKETYIDSIKAFVNGASAKLYGREYNFRNKDTTYYVPIECLEMEKLRKSPFGEWKEGYVVVRYDGQEYEYYWTGYDSAGYGIKLQAVNDLKTSSIEKEIDSINLAVLVSGSGKVGIIDKTTCNNNPTISNLTPPTKPVIKNPTGGNWVNTNFEITLKTTTTSTLAFWQYSYDNVTWTSYPGSASTTFKPPEFNTEINKTIYVRAVNKAEVAGKTVEIPSEVSSTMVRLDKINPTCASSGGSTAWTNVSRTLTGTCSDSGSGCVKTTITKLYIDDINSITEGPGTVSDNAGNSVNCPNNQTVRIDKSGPMCTSSGGNSAWTNGNITLTGTCSSNGSGCLSVIATKTYTVNTNSTTESPGSVYDVAGNSIECPNDQTVKIDKTAPTCTASGGSTTWTNVGRTLTGTCTDTGGSGCTNATITKSYTTPINSTTENPGTVTDIAGNSTACPSNQTVRIDKTAPTCTSSGGNTAWTNVSRILTGTCSDTGGSSCLLATITKNYTTDTNSTIETPGIVYDNAGNSADCPANQTVKVDREAPTCVSSGGISTWTNGNISLTGTCTDNGSGCTGNATKSYTANINSVAESPGTVTDNAGNSTTCPANQTVRIDKVAPTCVSSGGSTSWTSGNVTLIGTCTDTGGSSCEASTISKIYSAAINSTTESPGTIKDNAGNSTACPGNQTVRINKTAPVTPTITNPTGGNWTKQDFALTLTTTATIAIAKWEYSYDNTTWTAYPDSANTTFTTPNFTTDSNRLIYIRAVDASGLASVSASTMIRLDKTAPSCVSGGGSTAWTNVSRTLTGTCSDSGSGCSTATITKDFSTTINSTTESPGTVTDNAGNTAVCPGNQTVRVDKAAPTCTSSGGNTSWVASLTLTGTCADTGGSGCLGDVTKGYSTDINSTTESPGTVYDNAGNSVVCPGNQTVRIDKIAPSCSVTVSSGTGGSVSGWYKTNIGLTLNRSDTNSGISQYGLITSSTATYNSAATGTQSADTGGTTWYGYVKDTAGNTSTCNLTVYKGKELDSIAVVSATTSYKLNYSTAVPNAATVRLYFSDGTTQDVSVAGASQTGLSADYYTFNGTRAITVSYTHTSISGKAWTRTTTYQIVVDGYMSKYVWVHGLYSAYLGRRIEAGSNSWITHLANNGYSIAAAQYVAEGFILSNEFKNRNISVRDMIIYSYYALLGRPASRHPNETEIAGWVTVYNNAAGDDTAKRVAVVKGIMSSLEFSTYWNATPNTH